MIDKNKRLIGRLTRQIARTNATQQKRREKVAKLKAASKR
jgi:hypothetical protein